MTSIIHKLLVTVIVANLYVCAVTGGPEVAVALLQLFILLLQLFITTVIAVFMAKMIANTLAILF